jgi:hypothetical protein
VAEQVGLFPRCSSIILIGAFGSQVTGEEILDDDEAGGSAEDDDMEADD